VNTLISISYISILGAVQSDKVKPNQLLKEQHTLPSMFPKPSGDADLDQLIKAHNARRTELLNQSMLLSHAHMKHQRDVQFQSIIKEKDNHNVHGDDADFIPGLGGTKLRKLLKCDILLAVGLLQLDP
jgi:hypothetical protein